jgi:alcohol dehydrogenase (cytochrome c)
MIERLSGRGRVLGFFGAVALIATAFVGARSLPTHADSQYSTVTDQRLADAGKDDGWLMYRRTWDSQGHAPFDQINASNVASLKPVFTYDTGLKQGHEAVPIVNGKYMFITTPMDHVIALDATTGKVLWKFTAPIPQTALRTVCCDVVNRGVALYGDSVFIATLDNRVYALDATTGKVLWNKQLFAPGVGYSMTSAPLVVNGKVISGIAGGEYGGRGFIFALDAKTGSLAWKTYSVPAPDQPGGNTWPPGAYKTGGGSTWLTGSYDPDTKTLFWGVGNPAPWLADLRPGTNLYTDSVLALDPDTGAIKWHYQFTPHDTWDYDATSVMVLADIPYKGATAKALLHADRNGYLFALDRTNGKFLWAKTFVKATSVIGFKPDGTPLTNKASRPHIGTSIFTCPSFLGGTNWYPSSYDPKTGYLFVPTNNWCMSMTGVSTSYKAGLAYLGESFKITRQPLGGTVLHKSGGELKGERFEITRESGPTSDWGQLQAIDTSTGKAAWSYKSKLPWNGPVLSTAGGLVFAGTADQRFIAFDAKTGKPLWTYKTSSGVIGIPSTYQIDGKQYVAVYAGWGGATPIWGGPASTATASIPTGGRLYVFALPGMASNSAGSMATPGPAASK